RRLEQRDFVYEQVESMMAGQTEYRFRHVLVRDVCYQRLPRTARVACHERTAEWLDAQSAGRDTDLAEVLAHHRWAAHEIARTLNVNTERYAVAAREALHRAARRAHALHALDTAAVHATRALALYDAGSEEIDKLELELLATEISFYRDEDTFLAGAGRERIADLADRLHLLGRKSVAARAWTLLGQAAWVTADRATAWSSLDRAIELFEALPDSADKADAYAELSRFQMLCFERDRAIAAAGVAEAIAGRLGLLEVQANARITAGTARYQAGDRTGLAELEAVTEFCREHRLVALRRATNNLAWAVFEEGDWVRSQELIVESEATVVGGQSLTTGYSAETMRACYAGDFDRLLVEADAYVDRPTGRWDVQVRGLRWWVRTLRDEPFDEAAEADVAQMLAMARDSGFHRPRWAALATAALCRALQDRPDEAATLLDELVRTWREVQAPALPSGEWIGAAAYAATLTDRDSAAALCELLEAVAHRTPWAEAALRTVTAAVADADGDPERAGRLYGEAAEIYEGIPDTTDRMMALAMSADALVRAGREAAAAGILRQVRTFAVRNRAAGLLRLAGVKAAPAV
ncbi:MAG TPA: adenylyl cyclase, partial [Pilimelia sp.]|nr:adenylyl cyclase [Pilimelia sp.]